MAVRVLLICLVAAASGPLPSIAGQLQSDAITLASDAIQPHIAMGEKGIYVAFIHAGDISVRVSRDGGRSFSKPVIAIDVGGRARGGRHRGPRIGVDRAGKLTVTAPVTFDDNEYKKRYPTAELFVVQSADGGTTWSKPLRVNSVPKKAPEALHWMATADSGEVHIAWLDMRSREGRGQDIYYSTLSNGRIGENRKLAETVCECCAPGLAVDSDGSCLLAFREGGDGASREIFSRFSNDAGRTFARVSRVNATRTLEDG